MASCLGYRSFSHLGSNNFVVPTWGLILGLDCVENNIQKQY
jgi:hypothetical protein